jgi:glycosyltransferase involved in cell wall biosynthesis
MRIAIDARWIFNEISGIGAHTRELIRHLALVDRKNTYVLLFADRKLAERTWTEAQLSDKPNFKPDILPWGIFSPRSQVMLPVHLRTLRINVFHSTNYMIPLAAFPKGRTGRVKCVATIHDLIPMIFPSATPRAMKTRLFPVYKRLMLEVGARTDRIITVSEASRSDVITHLHIPEERRSSVVVIHNGVSELFKPPSTPPPPSNDPKTILYVGRNDPYKNLVNLIEAFAVARTRCPLPIRLQLIGPSDPRYPEAEERIRELNLSAHIDRVGYQSTADLIKSYQNAAATFLPSRYEGFGFPVVESMACGTPVICSDIPVLREVADHAALFVSPDNVSAMADAIVSAVNDQPLRERLIRAGLTRATHFTWMDNARRTVELYSELSLSADHQEPAS